MTIRPATPDEIDLLNDLTARSCLYWGYEEAFLDWDPESITVTEELLRGPATWVLEEDARVVGYYLLTGAPPALTLDKLFVDADQIGTGRGKRLWLHAVDTARGLGATELTFAADPNAAPFYRAMGAIWTSEEATTRDGWNLQMFRYPLPPQSPNEG